MVVLEVGNVSTELRLVKVKNIEEHFNKYGIRPLKLYHDYQNSLFKSMSVVGLPTSFLIASSSAF